MIEVVLPHREGVGAFVDVPDVRHILRGQVLVDTQADVEQVVLVAAGLGSGTAIAGGWASAACESRPRVATAAVCFRVWLSVLNMDMASVCSVLLSGVLTEEAEHLAQAAEDDRTVVQVFVEAEFDIAAQCVHPL